jgi:hypothetical protein
MSAMKRSWYGLLLLAVGLPACQSSGPKAPPAPPAPLPQELRVYEGALRIVPRGGEVKSLTLAAGQAPAGGCDVAVRVRSLSYAAGTARFALDSVGLPRLGERRQSCKRLEPALSLTLNGLPAALPDVVARIDKVLLTPGAYLRAAGTAFDRPAAGPPVEVASQLPDAVDPERRLARGVVAWPRELLQLDTIYHDPTGRGRHERLVGFVAVVGADGRLYRPLVKASINPAHEQAFLTALELWRFEPARRAEGPVGARVSLEGVLRVY